MKLKHNNKGFSLVELIVVIAIMAILGGVGTAGYTKYIEQTNKKADITMVGNIQRAIDTAAYSLAYTNSEAYKLSESLQASKSGAQIPVGFIILKNEEAGGVKTLESGSEIQETTCHLVTGDIVVTGQRNRWNNYYGDLAMNQFTYCETHTIFLSSGTYQKDRRSTTYTAPSDKIVSSASDIATTHTEGDTQKNYVQNSDPNQKTNSSLILNNILSAAYGDDYTDSLKLKYDKWDKSTIPSFYANANNLWIEMKGLASQLIDVTGGGTTYKLPIVGTDTGVVLISDAHGNSAQLMTNIANKVTADSEEEFVRRWEMVDHSAGTGDGAHIYDQNGNQTGGYYYHGYGFEYDFSATNSGGNREYYSAMRSAYNSCFASYVKENSSETHKDENGNSCGTREQHVASIQDFGSVPSQLEGMEAIGDLLGMKLPQLICRSAFEQSGSNLDSNVKKCNTCFNLYNQYVSSGASKENAKAMYNILQTVKETSEEAFKDGSDNFFDYYQNYLDEFETLYQAALSQSKGNSIVISVFIEDGHLTYNVSPDSANPKSNN